MLLLNEILSFVGVGIPVSCEKELAEELLNFICLEVKVEDQGGHRGDLAVVVISTVVVLNFGRKIQIRFVYLAPEEGIVVLSKLFQGCVFP